MNHTRQFWDIDDGRDQHRADDNRVTASLAGLVVSLLIVVVGLALIRALHFQANMSDCLLSGSAACHTLTMP